MTKIQAVKEVQLEIQREVAETIPTEKRSFLLAVSGGRDSSVLLDAFCSLMPKTSFFVAHFNHGLRPESEHEQNFVENLCESLSVQCFVEKAQRYDDKENLEAWARKARYQFLEKIRNQTKANFIVTAHQKTDLAETVLMRVISGRAAISLGGIKKIDFYKKLFRPMLNIPRELINSYIEEKNLNFVEDSSNSSLERTRNRLRLELMPQIEQDFNPGLVDSLCTFSERINQDEDSIWSIANRLYEQSGNTTSVDFYARSPSYLRWRLLSMELERQLGENKVGYLALSRLAEAIDKSEGSIKVIELGWSINCEFSRKGVLKFSFSG